MVSPKSKRSQRDSVVEKPAQTAANRPSLERACELQLFELQLPKRKALQRRLPPPFYLHRFCCKARLNEFKTESRHVWRSGLQVNNKSAGHIAAIYKRPADCFKMSGKPKMYCRDIIGVANPSAKFRSSCVPCLNNKLCTFLNNTRDVVAQRCSR